MITAITPFAFEDHLVRTVTDERGEPWFVVKDLCRVLDIADHHQALDSLDGDEVGRCIVPTSFGDKEVKTISESGMYALVFRSRKPEAKSFSKWIRTEVLPALRKTGTYTMPTPKPEIIEPASLKPIEQIPERLSRQMPDIQLSEEALYLRPAMRMRLWQDALQSARLDGSGMDYAVECFVKLCTVMAMQPKPKESPFREEVKRFIRVCCRPAAGTNLRASELYEAFRQWRKDHGKGYMPSKRVFGETMGLFYEKLHSNGQWYRDVSLVDSPAS